MLPEIGRGRRARIGLQTAAGLLTDARLRIQPLPSAPSLKVIGPRVAVSWCHKSSSSHPHTSTVGEADSERLFPLPWDLAAAFDLAAGR